MTFQGIITKSVNNTFTQWENLGHIANNMVNINTNGYKNIRFEQMLGEEGYLKSAIRTDYSQGSLRLTKSPYDVAIDGVGFIPVTSPTGEVQYTRDGRFKQGKNGYLVTSDDWIVGEGIQIPTNCYKFEIKPNGDVVSYDSAQAREKFLGKIPLVRFASQENLQVADMNRLASTNDSGEAVLVKDHNCFKQNNVEISNTSIFDETTSMLRINASLMASMQVLKVVDQMYSKAINIRES